MMTEGVLVQPVSGEFGPIEQDHRHVFAVSTGEIRVGVNVDLLNTDVLASRDRALEDIPGAVAEVA